jgi:hypothetical protein
VEWVGSGEIETIRSRVHHHAGQVVTAHHRECKVISSEHRELHKYGVDGAHETSLVSGHDVLHLLHVLTLHHHKRVSSFSFISFLNTWDDYVTTTLSMRIIDVNDST